MNTERFLFLVAALVVPVFVLGLGCPFCPPTDLCDGVTCDEGEECVDGVCVPVGTGVQVEASLSGDPVPGAVLTALVTVDIFDGSTLQSILWTQTNSVEVDIENADTDTATVTLPGVGVYKDELIMVLEEPPITEDQLPPNVPLPEGEFVGGLQDRFQVVGVNPFAIEEAGAVHLMATVTTTSGVYTAELPIETVLPFKTAGGIHNVPVGRAVLLHGKTQPSYDWQLTLPGGSAATLMDADTQSPYFTPDVAGLYTVTVTNMVADPAEQVVMDIYAGTWQGVITGQDGDGRPIASASCTVCHNDTIAPDEFTPWAQTGHAEIFSDNLDTSTHYGESCFECHTVGFDHDVDNGGFDDADDYDAFIAAGLLNNPGDNWTTMLADFPDAAQLANIQCEDCHGPQASAAHMMGGPRVDISSDVCAVCHGEPLRHARFQQWQLSGHANYELAIDEGQSGSCSRCHTGNGFLAWLPILLDDDPETDPTASIDVTWAEDETHPQTCATCHGPHEIGTTTGVGSNATVRISGDTPPLIAGFTATDVGRGAICMTCHNSRRGLRNDDTWDDVVADGDTARAPHGSSQTDVLMGENAYLVEVGTRGSHSLTAGVEDTCVTCHMEATPPPEDLAYEGGGTNHTFYARDDICGECHGFDSASVVQAGVEADLATLKGLIEDAILQLMADVIDGGNTIDLDGQATITDVADIAGIEFGESHGRQAITVTFTDDTVIGPVALSDVEADGQELYAYADERLPKSAWNYILISNDGSKGVHNPSFAGAVLDAAIEALEELNPPADPCEGVECDAGEECVDGECVPVDPCEGVECGAGEECVDGECVPTGGGGDPVAGEAFYNTNGCGACHGADATGGFGPSLIGESSADLLDVMDGTVSHTGGTVAGVTQQDADDLEAWLAP